MMKLQKYSLRLAGFSGMVLFGAFLLLTFYVPDWVEDFAYEFIESKVTERVDTSIDAVQPSEDGNVLSQLAASLYERNRLAIERQKEALKENIHERMADLLAEVRNLDCECRNRYARLLSDGFEFNIASLQAANDRIVEFVQSSYMDILIELKRDVRIFSGTNLTVFMLLLLVSFLKPQSIQHLFLPGALLTISTLVCSYFYIFEQNWLLAIIYNNYVGLAYAGYLGLVFLLLCDIVFNHARITSSILNGFLNAIGSAISVSPC